GGRETVVRRSKINRRPGTTMAMIEQRRRCAQGRGQLTPLLRIAAPETSQAVAIPVIPFGKPRRMVPQLITIRAGVPGFGYQLKARQDRVLKYGVEKSRTRIEARTLTPQRHPQVESKPVDLVALRPVPQGIHHHLQHARMRQ